LPAVERHYRDHALVLSPPAEGQELAEWPPAGHALPACDRVPARATHWSDSSRRTGPRALLVDRLAGVSIFQLARLMGTSVKMIDRTYGHLAHDSEDHLRELLAGRSGVEVATSGG
jgi:hypothetical protein